MELWNGTTSGTTKGRDNKMMHLGRWTSVSAALALCLALALGAAAPAMAADDARGRCVSEAARAGLIGRDSNPSNTNFVAGTEGDDYFFDGLATAGRDVLCGFGGGDVVGTLGEGDIFLGGPGVDDVAILEGGTFLGGAGSDFVGLQRGGTFNGGAGEDAVIIEQTGGTFNQD